MGMGIYNALPNPIYIHMCSHNHAENLDNLVPDAWYSWYHYSHPPLVERIAAIETMDKKAQ
ncbi:hypothetical protein EON63_10005 [archaeon]|nr:MAG: hypothetical protein EON63_10005 [archaeon]